MPKPIPPTVPDLQLLADALLHNAAAAGHRRLVVVSGSAVYTRLCLEPFLSASPGEATLWVGPAKLAPEGAEVLGSTLQDALGREFDRCVVWLHRDLDPNVLGAVAGAVRAGGLLIWLTPAFDDDAAWRVALADQLQVEGWGFEAIGVRFTKRLIALLGGCGAATVVREGEPPPAPPTRAPTARWTPPYRGDGLLTDDQAAAVELVRKVANGRARRPLVLTADRGRGKSASLGIAAAQLLMERQLRIVVTSPGAEAVATLFDNARRVLGQAGGARRGALTHGAGSLVFVPPGPLMAGPIEADLVLVDEAAGLPLPLLGRLAAEAPRVVFSTTVHGYEGTGRGLELRFIPTLRRRSAQVRRCVLSAPLRWAPDDPVEALVAQVLLMDTALPEPPTLEMSELKLEEIDRGTLASDEAALRSLMGLLVAAHYRTTPTDVLRALDAPNHRIFAATVGGALVGAAVVSMEGGLSAALSLEVARGERRPRGHLLPCALAFHHGLEAAAVLRGARVVRIATHPALQRRGVGLGLLEALASSLEGEGLDYLGTSFGATTDLVRFWGRAGLAPIRLGVQPGRSTGLRSALWVRSLSAEGRAVFKGESDRFAADLPLLLAGELRDLDPELAAELLALAGQIPLAVDSRDLSALRALASGLRDPELCAAALWRLVSSALVGGRSTYIPLAAQARLVARVLQHRQWAELAQAWGVAGRDQAVALLCEDVGLMLEAVQVDLVQ